jgi:hypothetical protein
LKTHDAQSLIPFAAKAAGYLSVLTWLQVEGECEKAKPPNSPPSLGIEMREAYLYDKGHPVKTW